MKVRDSRRMRISIYPSNSIIKWIRGKGSWQKLSGLVEEKKKLEWGSRVGEAVSRYDACGTMRGLARNMKHWISW